MKKTLLTAFGALCAFVGLHAADTLPNLAFYKYSSKPDSLYLTDSEKSTVSRKVFVPGDKIYINIFWVNESKTVAMPGIESFAIYLDDACLTTRAAASGDSAAPLKAWGARQILQGISEKTTSGFSLGEHTLRIVINPDRTFPESDYTDNEKEITFKMVAEMPTTYDVFFDANGGSGEMEYQTFAQDTDVTLPANAFTRRGCVFSGWATSANGEVVYKDAQSVRNIVPAGDEVTLYAVWAASKLPNLAFYQEDDWPAAMFIASDKSSKTSIDSIERDMAVCLRVCIVNEGAVNVKGGEIGKIYVDGESQEALTASSDVKSGYSKEINVTFPSKYFTVGTHTIKVVLNPDKKIEEFDYEDNEMETTLTVAAPPEQYYTVKYDANGGTGAMADQRMLCDAQVTLASNAFTRVGYRFIGWATSKIGKAEYADGHVVENLKSANGTITLYAIWYQLLPNLTFYAPETWPTSMFVAVSTESTQTVTSVVQGNKVYIRYSVANAGAADAAKGETLELYIDGDKENSDTASSPLKSGQFYSSHIEIETDNLSIGNHVFKLVLKADKAIAESHYDDNEMSVTLAVTARPSYVLAFDANGGTGTMAEMTVSCDVDTALKANAFKRTGYRFEGWSTNATGAVVYDDKQSVRNLAEAGGHAKLYAVWYELLPNLTLYTAKGWPDAAFMTTTSSTTKVDSFVQGDSACLRFCIGNVGEADTVSKETHTLYLDGVAQDPSTDGDTFKAGKAMSYYDVLNTDNFTVGEHTIKIVVNSDRAVVESDYDDNEKEITFTITRKPPVYYKVTFNANGGTVTNGTRSVESGTAVGELPTPTRDGYAFLGWFTSKTGGDPVTADSAIGGNSTCYAHWQALVVTKTTVKIAKPTAVLKLTYSGACQTGLKYDERLFVSGETAATNAGSHVAEFTLPDDSETETFRWSDGKTGVLQATWSIAALKITDKSVTIGEIPNQAYTGAAIEPAVAVTHNGKACELGADYTVAYANNIQIGKATVTVTGTGNFTGSKAFTFRIVETPKVYKSVTVDGTTTSVEVGKAVSLSAPNDYSDGTMLITCVGWAGTGDAPTNGTEQTVSFTLTQDSSIRWLYATNYWVQVEAEGTGSEIGGSVILSNETSAVENPGWYAAGTKLTAIARAEAGWALKAWSDGDVTLRTRRLMVVQPIALQVTFEPKPGENPGEGSEEEGEEEGGEDPVVRYGVYVDGVETHYVAGTNVTLRCPRDGVTQGTTNWMCVGWVGTGDVPALGTTNFVSFTVTQESSLTWRYRLDVEQVEPLSDGPAGQSLVLDAPETTLGGTVTWSAKNLPTGMKIATKNLTDKTLGAITAGAIYGTPTKPGTYVATVTAKSGKKSEVIAVEITIGHYVDETMPLDDAYGTYVVGTMMKLELGDEFANCKATGLPSGLKFAAKAVTDKTFGAIAAGTVYGVPTKAVTNAVIFTKTVSAKNAAGKTVKTTHTASATFAVAALPTWAYGTFNGLVGENAGAVTLTVGATGKVSGKIVTGGETKSQTWTFSATAYESFGDEGIAGTDGTDAGGEDAGEASEDLVFYVNTTAKCGKETRTLKLSVAEEGVTGSFGEGVGDEGIAETEGTDAETLTLWRNGWKDKGATTRITSYVGSYTARLACEGTGDGDLTRTNETGYGYLTLTIDAKGNCKAAGKLPDGTSASGTLPLVWDDRELESKVGEEDEGGAPVAIWQLMPSAYKGGYVCGLLTWSARTDTSRASGTVAGENIAWVSHAPTATAEYGAGFERTMNVRGGNYEKCTPEDVKSSYNVTSVTLPSGFEQTVKSFSFTAATGVFKGTFMCADTNLLNGAKAKSVSFEGVLVQRGLGDEDTEADDDALSGFFLWDQTGSYTDAKTNKEKTFKYKESYPLAFDGP